MSAFSYTAPTFTEADRECELASLSEEERLQIENEVRGIDTENENDDHRNKKKTSYSQTTSFPTDTGCHEYERLTLATEQMESEILEIPLDEKIDYENALIQVPDLVESETPYSRFLHKYNYDAALSAKQLVLYWKHRVTFFKDKAFLPMTIQGALQDDIGTLRTGFMQILPNDAHGRFVIYHEKSRAKPKLHHRDALCRVAFYIFHVIYELSKATKAPSEEDLLLSVPTTTTPCSNNIHNDDHHDHNHSSNNNIGFVTICYTASTMMEDFDRLYCKSLLHMSTTASSQWLKGAHFQSPHLWFLPSSLVLPVCYHIMPKRMRTRCKFYNSVHELEQYGMASTILPTCMGGDFDRFEYLDQWIQERIDIEEIQQQKRRHCQQ